ncbi:MAG: AraC family transcriptional regulator [Oribacterium sp.]|nr:AraC family transcriptional regulator [Oribacterium sp.]
MKRKLQSIFDTRQKMRSDSFEIYYYSDTRFPNVEKHAHSFYEIYLFEEGKVSLEIEDNIYEMKTGDVIIVPPKIYHRAVSEDTVTVYRRFVVWISEATVADLISKSESYGYMYRKAEEKKEYIYHLDTLAHNNIKNKLIGILEELHTERFGKEEQLENLMRDFLLNLNRFAYHENEKTMTNERISVYQTITDYISTHLEDDLSLDALSEYFYLNKYYIAHLVQENTGLSLHQYITKKRLSACCEAARDGQLIGDVCAQYGFQNYSGFYRAFKKEYGMSPTAYIEKYSYRPKE